MIRLATRRTAPALSARLTTTSRLFFHHDNQSNEKKSTTTASDYCNPDALKQRIQSVWNGTIQDKYNFYHKQTGHFHMDTSDFSSDAIDEVIAQMRTETNLCVTRCNTFKVMNARPLDPPKPDHKQISDTKPSSFGLVPDRFFFSLLGGAALAIADGEFSSFLDICF